MKRTTCAAFTALCLFLSAIMPVLAVSCGKTPQAPGGADTAASSPAAVSHFKAAIDELTQKYAGTSESEDDAELLGKRVSVSADGAAQLHEIAGSATEYPYTDLMQLGNAYSRYLAMPEYQSEGDVSFPDGIASDARLLYERVKQNNVTVTSSADYLYGTNELDDDYLMWVCGVICDTLKAMLLEPSSYALLGDLQQNIDNLRIYANAITLDRAFISTDNSLYINTNAVSYNSNEGSGEHRSEQTISHETIHLMQSRSRAAAEALGVSRMMGFCPAWDDLPVNPLFFYWFIEGSAEILASGVHGGAPESYTSVITFIDSLSLISFLNGGALSDVPRLSLQPELEKVFEAFRCETDAQKLELLYFFISVELFTDSGSVSYLEGFYSGFEDAFKQPFGAENAGELKAAAAETLSKYFYRSLAGFTADNNPAVREVFYLISVFEFNLNKLMRYDNESNANSLRSALQRYAELQGAYFEAVAGELGLGGDELYEYYEAYHSRSYVPKISLLYDTREEWTGTEIAALDSGQNSFLDSFYHSGSQRKTAPVRAVVSALGDGGAGA